MLRSELIMKHHRPGITTFIETGTHLGATVFEAIRTGLFDRIITIEFDEALYNRARATFSKYPAVEVLHGDSSEEISRILETVDGPAMFWLDSHFNAGDPRKKECPVVGELRAIGRHSVKGHTILIDDMRYMTLDPRHNGITRERVVEMVKSIDQMYTITYERNNNTDDDILVAAPEDR